MHIDNGLRLLQPKLQSFVLPPQAGKLGCLGIHLAPARAVGLGPRVHDDAGDVVRLGQVAALRHEGVIAKAARDLGLSRQSLYRRMEKLGIATGSQDGR